MGDLCNNEPCIPAAVAAEAAIAAHLVDEQMAGPANGGRNMGLYDGGETE